MVWACLCYTYVPSLYTHRVARNEPAGRVLRDLDEASIEWGKEMITLVPLLAFNLPILFLPVGLYVSTPLISLPPHLVRLSQGPSVGYGAEPVVMRVERERTVLQSHILFGDLRETVRSTSLLISSHHLRGTRDRKRPRIEWDEMRAVSLPLSSVLYRSLRSLNERRKKRVK